MGKKISVREPLLHPDLEIIGNAIKQRGMRWGMDSNGLILTGKRLQALVKAGLTSVTISIDTKKKEMTGNFANKGKTWAVDGIATYDDDFRTYASGIAIPFGIYDCIKNIGVPCPGHLV